MSKIRDHRNKNFRGVTYVPSFGKFLASVKYQGKSNHLGLFKTALGAALAVNKFYIEIGHPERMNQLYGYNLL